MKASHFWSGDHVTLAIDSLAGRPLICRSLPSATFISHSFSPKLKRLSENVRGLMRRPASFSSGCATTWIEGSDGICIIAATSRRGDRYNEGARGASTTACSAADGSS